MDKPEDIPESVWAEAEAAKDNAGPSDGWTVVIARAILAEREASEKRMADLLKDPVAVRVNFLRGSIACQPLIDEAVAAEREHCAKIAESHAGRIRLGGYNAWHGADNIAAAIRQVPTTNEGE